ncbi:uncharacterized protein LOC124265112 isoform X4 [Haliotis rubra]|uniref:uncharacterized protein LOC124265112 isoform X4 n=1 Tax=Haliotis rubra TaxID=36100 RepID=UPI001EE58358|nr:uncharacterized protein LOC124265112 isoform X4 [Haliotis rubra]
MNTLCTSQGAGQKSTWRGCTLWGCTWLLLLLVMVGMGTPESLVANETDDSASSIVQVKSTFDDAHLSTQRVNWFLQCISNCLSGNLDDQPTILGAKGNITVEALFTCNRFCITAGPNFNNTNHTHVGIAVGR